MSGRQYVLVTRNRGLLRHGAQDVRTWDVLWFLTRWGAVRWIEMHDSRHHVRSPR